MRLHLPKKLLAAVVTAMTVGNSYAAYYDSINEVIKVESGETETYTPCSQEKANSESYSIAKDGEGTLLYTGSGTECGTIYVREGELQYGDGETETSIKFTPQITGAEGRYTALGVAGKDAVVRFNNASASCNETANFVGGLDGNGTLIIENGSNVDFAGSNVFVIGDIAEEEAVDPETGVPDGYNNSTTAIPGGSTETGDGRYHGNYTAPANGSDYTMGRGEVIIKDGSYFRATYGNFWIINGSMTAQDEGTVVDIALDGYGYRNWMALGSNSEASLIVKDGAKVTSRAYQLFMGYGDNAVATIEVDNASYELIGQLYGGKESEFIMGYAGNNATANVIVKNGGSVTIGSKTSFIGSGTAANLCVGKNSSFSAKNVLLYSRAKVENEGIVTVQDMNMMGGDLGNKGTMTAQKIDMNGGTLTNEGTLDVQNVDVWGGSMTNTGTLNVVIDDDDANTFATLNVGSSMTNSGTINVEDTWIVGELTNSGTINTDYLRVRNNGELTLTQGEGAVNVGWFKVTDSGSVSVNVAGDGSENAAITMVGGAYDQLLELTEGTTFDLTFSQNFISTIEKEATVNVWVATGLGADSTYMSTISTTLDAAIWDTSNLEWKLEGSSLYITGALTKIEDVKIENVEEVTGDISDVDLENPVSVEIKGTEENQDVTISGDNTHTGGTTIEGANVTLGSASALGNGQVVTEGTSSLTTSGNVTAFLPEEITNKGDLTMSGSYDGSSLETIVVEDTRVCVDGKEGNNGFYREGGSAILVVDNQGNATLTVDDGTTVKSKDGDSLKLYANGLAAGELDYSNYHIEDGNHSAAMSEIQGMRPDATADLTITMNDGELVADADVTNVQSSGGTIMTQGEVEVSGKLSGSTSVVVTGESDATISGDNDYTGDTIISGDKAKLTVGDDNALGEGQVQLHDKGTLDLNDKAISNYINVTGGELHNASAYTGNIDVSGNLTICGTDATAGKVTLINGGTIAPEGTEALTLGTLEVAAGASAPDQIAADTTVTDSLVLNNGAVLTMTGSLTMANGSAIVLQGKGYRSGQIIVTSGAGSDLGGTTVTMHNGKVAYTLLGDNQVQLTAVFDNSIAEALTVSNWGIATASRTFVNAVRGQRTNTGCIANGRGTAWAAVLGGTSDIGSGDIDLKGAAVGADMKVGNKSSLGVAFGYIDGDAQIPGLSKAEQDGTYVALYGEHGLKKLSATSCLSLDWVAAYGQTDTEWNGMDWEQDSLQLNTRLNWNKKVTDRLCMSVFGGLEYFTSESDTVENTKTGSIQNLRGEIGVGARYVAWGTPAVTDGKSGLVLARGCEKLVLHGEIRYMNDMVRSNPVIEQDGLRGSGDNPGRQGTGIEAGATYRIGERWSASANYGFNTMEDSREHRVNVGASYTF